MVFLQPSSFGSRFIILSYSQPSPSGSQLTLDSLPFLILLSQFHPLLIVLPNNPVKKNQFAASSTIKVLHPALLSFYGREAGVEVSAPRLIPNIGMTGFLMQVLHRFR